MIKSTHFNIDEWKISCEKLQKEVIGRSGCNYELFVENFSFEINIKLASIPIENHLSAIQIAKDYDYATAEELAENADHSRENGYCIHHFDIDCCPLGCGSL